MKKHNAIELYDKFTELRNAKEYRPLSRKVFVEQDICTFRDLTRHLKKYGEYGGAVRLNGVDGLVLLPFHNDILNTWLTFDNPRVVQVYELIYSQYGRKYSDRDAFERDRFNIEETLLKECWSMPAMDTRILNAPIAGCWDKMEIQANFLASMGYRVKRFCFHGGKIIRGHTFVLYNDGKKWSTCTGYPFAIKTKDLLLLCKWIFTILRHVPILDKGETCELVEFASPHEGMSTQEYIQLIESGTVIMKCARKEGRHRWPA